MNSARRFFPPGLILLLLLTFIEAASACMWDRDTLSDEAKKSPTLAEAILKKPEKSPPIEIYLQRLKELNANPKKDDPFWWNDVAGAYLRMGRAKEAARLLEPVMQRFTSDYGIHANLGTAYHLMGRFADAEREISRDLEINPEGHFGLEKYHLALLQYLMRDENYRKDHVYVDEFSFALLKDKWDDVGLMRFGGAEMGGEANPQTVASNGPSYRLKWDLAANTNLQAGVIYMATLNPKESACFVMLGVACLAQQNRDLNLAVKAFEKAILFGSPQSSILTQRIATIHNHQAMADEFPNFMKTALVVIVLIIILVIALFKAWVQKPPSKATSSAY
jgi:tetratricopeptide (TPR) repeat protein